ncbi:FAD/NAD(P)-binding protein [Streptomyces sp. NPDC093223]|uniref:FAD/NAD(P)-binding protein n=1 Tax=Streptomyces sp. NPDC093223 TaxID=3366033 RepID=UPI0038308B29
MNGRLGVGIVGAGPRGLTVLERLCANAAAHPVAGQVTVHVVDPAPAGAGRVWRTEQSPYLLMNTVAEQITVFTDPSVTCDGPVTPGPDLYAWAALLAVTGPAAGYPEDVLAQARALTPGSYPTRALYGHYLKWAFRRTVETAPANVTVRVHQDTAVALDGRGATQLLRLAGGDCLRLDTVILSQGHVETAESPSPRGGARRIGPGNPAETDLDGIGPGEPVALRGLGLSFFDYLALFTQGRGGVFEERADGTLDYRPSGREPRLYAGSRRGIPHQARGENQKRRGERHRPVLLTDRRIRALRRRAGSDADVRFRRDVWPLIAREVELVYYRALLRRRGASAGTVSAFQRAYLSLPERSPLTGRLLRAHGIAVRDRWDWAAVETPYGDEALSGRKEFTDWLVTHLEHDAALARGGNTGDPVKSALDALRDLRNEIRQVVDHGRITGDSYRDELAGWYSPFNAALSIGPPGRRVAEMAAVIRAGVLEPVGPGMRVVAKEDGSGFWVSSTRVPGPLGSATTLIEARIQDPDVRRTADPLLRHLLDTGQAAAYRIPNPDGSCHETGGLAVTERPSRLVDAQGRPHPHRFALGVPTEGAHWATAAGVRPGVDSVTLGDADAIARAVLGIGAARNSGQVELGIR